MDEPRITYTGTIQTILRELDNSEAIHAVKVVEHILQHHTEYGSDAAREVLSTSWPDFTKEESQTAAEWLEQVRAMLDPLLVNKLHGRLVILGLCHLDKTLARHLRSFIRELKKELLEDFDSLLLPEYSGEQGYRREFLKILQNRGKSVPDPDFSPRNSGFVVLTSGGIRLDIMAGLCFQQSWNSCLTARYKVNGNGGFNDFLQSLALDLKGLAKSDYGTIGSFLPEPGKNQRPGANRLSWAERVRSLPTNLGFEGQQPDLILEDIMAWCDEGGDGQGLSKGQRLVLLLEWRGLSEEATPESIEYFYEMFNTLQRLPERMGIVISGLPESIRSMYGGPPYYELRLPREEPPKRGQHLDNDIPHGEDQLDVLDEARALADAIALKDLSPPLVVGVFGGWGAGKSFVLHLIEQRLQDLRCEEIGSGDDAIRNYPFIGHPYLIHFDAWTYAKGNLWASLMQTTLVELDRQISLERELAAGLSIDPCVASPVWKLLWQLSDEQRQILTKTELGRKALDNAKQFMKNGSPGCLWDELMNLHDKETGELKIRERELDVLRKQHLLAKQKLEAQVDKELSMDAQKIAWLPVWEEFRDMVKEKIDESDAVSFDEMMKAIPASKKLLVGVQNLSLPAMTFMLVAVVGGFVLARADYIIDIYSQVAGVLVAISTPIVQAWNWFEKRRDAYEQRLTTIQESKSKQRLQRIEEQMAITSKGSPGEEVAKTGEELREKEATVDRIRSQIGIIGRARSLNDFLDTRLEEGLYQKELGLLDQVQSDIQELSDTLLPSRAPGMRDRKLTDELFPRGDPRVVLFIDDLDRCPPDKVVEVLEAAQLLVKTQLFVIVIAIDVRYVTRALENEYKGVLVRSGEPSGLDYIEKIIQIPYRVRSVSEHGVGKFMRSQMEILEKVETEKDDINEETGTENMGLEPKDTADDQIKRARLAASAQATRTDSITVSPKAIQFDPEEYAAITESCSALAVSPRTMKRLVNVFKLLKLIWYRQGLDDGPFIDIKKAMLAILALCSRYPEVLRKLLAEMEVFYRDSSNNLKQPLVAFLVKCCEEGAREAL